MPSIDVRASGHEHVAATHESTLEVTSDDFLTPAGDCIVGIEADLVPADFEAEFVSACQDSDASIVLALDAGGYRDLITGRGDPGLSFEGDRSLVCRTSDYVDDRTVMVGADAAAVNLDRDLVAALADGADLVATLTVD
jgi:hypothetical protein